MKFTFLGPGRVCCRRQLKIRPRPLRARRRAGIGHPLCTSLTHAPHLNALHLHALHQNALYLHALYLNAIFVDYCSALYVHKRARLGGFGAPGGGKGEYGGTPLGHLFGDLFRTSILGGLLVALGLHFGSILGPLLPPFGSLLAPFGTLWRSVGSFLGAPGAFLALKSSFWRQVFSNIVFWGTYGCKFAANCSLHPCLEQFLAISVRMS